MQLGCVVLRFGVIDSYDFVCRWRPECCIKFCLYLLSDVCGKYYPKVLNPQTVDRIQITKLSNLTKYLTWPPLAPSQLASTNYRNRRLHVYTITKIENLFVCSLHYIVYIYFVLVWHWNLTKTAFVTISFCLHSGNVGRVEIVGPNIASYENYKEPITGAKKVRNCTHLSALASYKQTLNPLQILEI